MAGVCASSLKLSLPNILRTALRSEFASDAHQGPAYRRIFSVTPVSQNRCQTQRRNFGYSVKPQIRQTAIHLSAPDSSSSASDNSSTAPLDSSEKDTRRTSTEANASPELADAKTSHVNSLAQTPSSGNPSDKDRTKSSRSKNRSRQEQRTSSPIPQKKPEKWQIHRQALKEKFKDGWNPPKKLSPDALEGIRHLHAVAPEKFTTSVLAEEFKISPEAIRRILKSKWRPSETEIEDRRKRWERRHDRIWGHLSELGLRPSTKRTRDLTDANQLLYGNKKKGGKA
ncbi:required for respiratory growth protein 9 mitochondrial [Aspergillus brasiliensis]|uniref:Required for respiratory growth protein 9, mitochondrial n=1 Tax=Aspergillus brasiliensis TaxID=319629 RepID=A0A9W6DIZ3_9EURO|nr:required for respiratory growth protein 9 mitochondrial [Aspergillus brasiliensis]GKZ44057.1 required for respiratory growth protein 9 mitochondrial [Aspergillus brasiliensis]